MGKIMSQKMSDSQRLLRPASAICLAPIKRSPIKRAMLNLLRWSQIAGTTSVMSLAVGMMPALAEELSAWNYDTETRSLNITLPVTTTPTISVTADDQLLVELPNTQVGRAIGQTVFDGVVESIVLEQATPETVWMVVDFAPGTILASAQSALPLESSGVDGAGMQQWQVRPALMATRRVADAIAALPADTAANGNADALRSEPTSATNVPIAQAADFPDLPILEPAIPISSPIAVPPITARATPPVQPAPLPPVAVSRPPVETVMPVTVPTITEADAVENESEVAILAPEVPLVPPLVEEAAIEIEPVDVESIEAEVEPVEEAEVEVERIEIERVEVEEAEIEAVEVVAAPTNISPVALSTPPVTREIERQPSEIVIPEIDLSANESARATTSRWPAPIPFGQPLP